MIPRRHLLPAWVPCRRIPALGARNGCGRPTAPNTTCANRQKYQFVRPGLILILRCKYETLSFLMIPMRRPNLTNESYARACRLSIDSNRNEELITTAGEIGSKGRRFQWFNHSQALTVRGNRYRHNTTHIPRSIAPSFIQRPWSRIQNQSTQRLRASSRCLINRPGIDQTPNGVDLPVSE